MVFKEGDILAPASLLGERAALPRRGGAGRPRPSERGARCGAALRQAGRRSRKTGEAIPRGESGLCDPRRPQVTTGASVRLTCVAQARPYSPRRRAQRGYEPRRFSRPAERAADGQCRHAAFAGGADSLPFGPDRVTGSSHQAQRRSEHTPLRSPPLRPRVLSPDSPTWCSAQIACHGSRLRATRGAPSSATRALRSGAVS